jgi:hypothetical protein
MIGATNFDRHFAVLRVLIVACFIVFAAVVRVLPHPWNFTPIGAMALFGGAKLRRPWQAFLFPLAALFCGDLIVGLHSFMLVVYASFCISVFIGIAVRERQTIVGLSVATLLGALQFFLVTNFAVWKMMGTYPATVKGLTACYAAGIPLFWNTLAGDAFYAVLLFGGFALVGRFHPELGDRTVAVR